MIRRWLSGQGATAIRHKQRYHQLRDRAELAVLADPQSRVPHACPVCGARSPASLTNPLGATWAQCPSDGTIYADPVPTDTALDQLQNDASQAFPFLRGRQGVDARVDANFAELVALDRMLPVALGPTTRLLDVGCGPGGLLLAARTRCEARGVELQAAAVEVAWRNGLDVKHARFETLTPFERFHVIAFVCVLEHVAQPARLLEAAKRWLTPGGFVYAVTPNAGAVSLAHLRERHSHLSSVTNVTLLARQGLGQIAAVSGFRVARHAFCGGRDLSLSDLITEKVAPRGFRHRFTGYRPQLHQAFALAEQFVPEWVFPAGEDTFQRALLTLR